MKIAMLSASFRGGGAERVQITLAGELARLGHDAHLVVFDDDGPLRSEIPKGVGLTVLGVKRVALGLKPLIRFLGEAAPDVVITAMMHVGTIALLARRLSRWNGKVIVRADGSRRYHGPNTPAGKRSVLDLLQRILLPKADALIGVSNAIAEEFREDFGLGNCHVIHNPVAARRVGDDPPQHRFFDSGRPVFIAAGRLAKQKGFLFLIQAFSEVHESLDSKLIILGEGDERSYLEEEIGKLGLEEHVDLPGFVPDPIAWIGRASVFVLPSETEPFGLTLVEALSTGIPVVCTETEGPMDIIDDKRLGIFAPFGRQMEFGTAMKAALESPDEYGELRIARAGQFTPATIAEKYLDLIESLQ
jgi:glycosyltransferase involved in cell wall biosynthesis